VEIAVSSNVVTISGNIKSINDLQAIKNTLDTLSNNSKSITLIIKDSLSITSSVVGYLNKLVLKDHIKLHIKVGNSELMSLFDELNLTAIFQAEKI